MKRRRRARLLLTSSDDDDDDDSSVLAALNKNKTIGASFQEITSLRFRFPAHARRIYR